MRLLVPLIATGMICLQCLARPAQAGTTTAAPLQLVPCTAEVIWVKNERWTPEALKRSMVYPDYSIRLKFLGPPKYASRIWTLWASTPTQFTYRGHILEAGDVISFSAYAPAIEVGTICPSWPADLQLVTVMKKPNIR